MENLELGKSYDAKELAEICGVNEDDRYGYYAFVGEKATVIAQDEGNDVVKVIQINKQTPICPACHTKIDTIYTSRIVHLKFKDGKWIEEQDDHYFINLCPYCYEELSGKELIELGVPEEIICSLRW